MPFWNIFTKRAASQSDMSDSTTRQTSARATVAEDKAKVRLAAAASNAPLKLDDAGLEIAEERSVRSMSGKGGFDPYNSGAFDRRGNWDKTKLK